MEKRIHVFSLIDIEDFEESVNEFLKDKNGKLHDIKFSVEIVDNDITLYSALLIYTPEAHETQT